MYKSLLIDTERLFEIVEEPDTGLKRLIVTIPSVGWKDIHFRITDDEYALARSKAETFYDLVDRLALDKGTHFYVDRLLK